MHAILTWVVALGLVFVVGAADAGCTGESRETTDNADIAPTSQAEFHHVAMDIKAIKVVLNSLVEDNVKVQGKLRLLQDVGFDVRNLRDQVRAANSETSRQVYEARNSVDNFSIKLERQATAQIQVTALMSTQMKHNNDSLVELGQKIKKQESKTVALESKVVNMETDVKASVEKISGEYGGQIETLNGVISELQGRLDSLQRK